WHFFVSCQHPRHKPVSFGRPAFSVAGGPAERSQHENQSSHISVLAERGRLLMAKPNILCDCAGLSNDRWLEYRTHGPKGDIPYTVGGSDVAAIFGVSPWQTPLELWLVKKGRMKAPPKGNADQLAMGHLLETIA